jgi:valyl-tRNA synthetase
LVKFEGESTDETDNTYWVSAHDQESAMVKAKARFPDKKISSLYHDEDVLDTWFSSGIFPFSICGWPDQTADLSKFYPGTLLETGHDILFFWVARMVMMGEELTGKLPFDTVYLHAIIRDAHGRKMSKSLGNIIDPLDVITGSSLENLNKQLLSYNLDPKEVEKAIKGQSDDFPAGIPECGTDALRFALCAYTSQGRDINLDVLRIQGYRNFCNKLWNATRFAMINGLGLDFRPQETSDYLANDSNNKCPLRPMDAWILSRLSETVQLCNAGLKSYELTLATTGLFNFWLYSLCDYYIEYLKSSFYAQEERTAEQQSQLETSREVLYTCLDVGLRLISPFMPFISEELYQRLPRRRPLTDAPSICVTPYPLPSQFDVFRSSEIETQVKFNLEAINKIRSLRADYQLTPKTKVDIFVQSFDAAGIRQAASLRRFQDLIQIMTNAKECTFLDGGSDDASIPVGCVFSTLSDKCKVYMLLKGVIDIEKEQVKLAKRREALLKQIEAIKRDQAMPNYESKVPEEVKVKNQEKLSQLANEIELIDDGVKQLQAMHSTV